MANLITNNGWILSPRNTALKLRASTKDKEEEHPKSRAGYLKFIAERNSLTKATPNSTIRILRTKIKAKSRRKLRREVRIRSNLKKLKKLVIQNQVNTD